jgi:hypothetical protein
MIAKSGYRFFGKDHAPSITWSEMTIPRKVISLHGDVGAVLRLQEENGIDRKDYSRFLAFGSSRA